MPSIIAVIGCIVGVITCVIGVATFASAQMSRAKQDGMLLAKIEQCIKNTEEIKEDSKQNNHEIKNKLEEHSIQIAQLRANVESLFKQFGALRDGGRTDE